MKSDVEPAVRSIRSRDVELAYQAFGDRDARPMVLISGLGAQMVAWRTEFCRGLAGRGYYVVRFDNRDVGLSTKFSGGAYSIADMAGDVAGLIEGLGLGSAHVVGQSLGGVIAQELVIRHPHRVRSLCFLYSTPNLSHFTDAAGAIVAGTPPRDRGEAIEQYLLSESACASRDYPQDVKWIRELGGIMWDRGWYPEGKVRQMTALLNVSDLAPALRAVTAPTAVIHGDADPLISRTGGEALAEAIPGTRLHIIPGMGHELPAAVWPEVMDVITANTLAEDEPAGSRNRHGQESV